MRRISKDITKHYQMTCSSGELHAICFLWAHVFYVLILPFFTAFLLHEQIVLALIRIMLKSRCFPNWRCLLLFDHLSEGILIFRRVSDKCIPCPPLYMSTEDSMLLTATCVSSTIPCHQPSIYQLSPWHMLL